MPLPLNHSTKRDGAAETASRSAAYAVPWLLNIAAKGGNPTRTPPVNVTPRKNLRRESGERAILNASSREVRGSWPKIPQAPSSGTANPETLRHLSESPAGPRAFLYARKRTGTVASPHIPGIVGLRPGCAQALSATRSRTSGFRSPFPEHPDRAQFAFSAPAVPPLRPQRGSLACRAAARSRRTVPARTRSCPLSRDNLRSSDSSCAHRVFAALSGACPRRWAAKSYWYRVEDRGQSRRGSARERRTRELSASSLPACSWPPGTCPRRESPPDRNRLETSLDRTPRRGPAVCTLPRAPS